MKSIYVIFLIEKRMLNQKYAYFIKNGQLIRFIYLGLLFGVSFENITQFVWLQCRQFYKKALIANIFRLINIIYVYQALLLKAQCCLKHIVAYIFPNMYKSNKMFILSRSMF